MEREALARARTEIRTDAQLRAALLRSEVARFRLLPLALAGDSDVKMALNAQPGAQRTLNRKLESLAAEVGAAAIYVISTQGQAIAASNWRSRHSFVGQDFGFRSYFQQAQRSGSASQFGLGTVSRKPGLYISRLTPDDGVIVVKLEFGRIEEQWARARGTTLVEDRNGIVLVTSEPALRFAAAHPLTPDVAARVREELQLDVTALQPLPSGGTSLVVAVPTSVEDWRLVLSLPRRAAIGNAVLTAQLGAAVLALLIAAALALWFDRSRRRRAARELEVARTAELEEVVSARTAELQREMEERQASEARAAILREGLRQANRLATLGQVTASVAHETAQPVAAIRTYASNGERLLDSGATDEVRSNLQAIGRLAGRIGTVTAGLRGFARKGARPLGPIPLRDAIEGALLILKERLRRIEVFVSPVAADLLVVGGRVRLEQVLVNLLQNAAEALGNEASPRVSLTVEPNGHDVRIVVADNGPGIAPEIADRLFTPFATSRTSGLGLGLVIAQDIAHDLGGSLRLLPGEGGAQFELLLRRVYE